MSLSNKLGNVIKQSFHEILSESFKRYAKYIIQDRALPDIRDGLKPVQRRILYAMLGLGLHSNKPYKKSARTVGEVIGKYHPHGDASIYEALVRMAQDWKNNLVLIDMQGNKGSIDGDAAAAMRYTESRLSLFAERLLGDIDKKIVRFVHNFDDSEYEPTVLPSLLPNLLINGASGIASGYATNIPPHNPTEVFEALIFRLENPDCNLSQICRIIKGPDFPTSGIIQGASEIKSIYKFGHGKVSVMAQIDYDASENALVVKSIPFETNKSMIIKNIDEIISANEISGILSVTDGSDQHGINIVIKLDKTVGENHENIKNYLLKNTSLRISYAANMVAIIAGKPVQFTLLQYLDSFLNHALNVVVKSAEYELKSAQRKLEIISGLIKATTIIDQLIQVIRNSLDRASAKNNIVAKFGFSELQADAIVQLRLYRLTNTDVSELTQEASQLQQLINQLKQILNNESYRKNYLKDKFLKFKNEFISKRKTKIEAEISKLVLSTEDLIVKKQLYVSVSRDGYIKTTPVNFSLSVDDYLKCGLKERDILIGCESVLSDMVLVLITSCGNFITIPIHKINEAKWRELGSHLNYLTPLQDGEKIVAMFNARRQDNEHYFVVISKFGLIKQIAVSDLIGVKHIKTSTVIKFKSDDDCVASACISRDSNDFVFLFTHNGRALKYELAFVPKLGARSSGVRAISLLGGDYVVSGLVLNENEWNNHYICIIGKNGAKRVNPSYVCHAARNTTGKSVFWNTPATKGMFSAQVVKKNTYLNVVLENGNARIILARSIPITQPASKLTPWRNAHVVNAQVVNFKKTEFAPTIPIFDDDQIV